MTRGKSNSVLCIALFLHQAYSFLGDREPIRISPKAYFFVKYLMVIYIGHNLMAQILPDEAIHRISSVYARNKELKQAETTKRCWMQVGFGLFVCRYCWRGKSAEGMGSNNPLRTD